MDRPAIIPNNCITSDCARCGKSIILYNTELGLCRNCHRHLSKPTEEEKLFLRVNRVAVRQGVVSRRVLAHDAGMTLDDWHLLAYRCCAAGLSGADELLDATIAFPAYGRWVA